jgi:hypothetical protein
MLRGGESVGSDGQTSTRSQVIIDAGPKGGTHGHYDLLNFEYWGGLHTPLIPDPGPFRYDDSADRAYVISTPAHNTISIDGLNHEAIEGLDSPKIVVDEMLTTATEGRFTAHHHAYEYLAGRPTVGRTIWIDRTNSGPGQPTDMMIAIDWGRSDIAHTFTTSFNLFGDATHVVQSAPGIIDAYVTKNSNLRVQSLEMPSQQIALVDTFVTSRPPPDDKETATRLAISQTGKSALFVTFFSSYTVTKQGTVPNPPPTIAFETPPQPGQPVHLRITYADNTTRSLTFAPPDLAPLSN